LKEKISDLILSIDISSTSGSSGSISGESSQTKIYGSGSTTQTPSHSSSTVGKNTPVGAQCSQIDIAPLEIVGSIELPVTIGASGTSGVTVGSGIYAIDQVSSDTISLGSLSQLGDGNANTTTNAVKTNNPTQATIQTIFLLLKNHHELTVFTGTAVDLSLRLGFESNSVSKI
jgi:hypothetical protein